ncbi:hypothetical protein LTR39_000829 [Cryomyces antarcticus]|nr:hypothetical protein LTR39_000829 [Cryomyces antarcticus]
MNALLANEAQEELGDRPTTTFNKPDSRPNETVLVLRWYGNEDVRVEEEITQLQKGEILGHEWTGIVDEVGTAVKSVKKGGRVVASFLIAEIASVLNCYPTFCTSFTPGLDEHSCGQCSFCEEGLTSMCDRTNSSILQEKLYGKPFAGLFGYSRFAGGFADGQAEYVRCPFADVNLLKIPDSVPDEKALYLSDILPTSYHATVCADTKEGKSVQRAMSKKTDSSEVVDEALRACPKFGIVALVADHATKTNQVLISALVEKGVSLRGIGQASVQKYWHELLKKVESGEFDPTVILTHRFVIDEASELYDA